MNFDKIKFAVKKSPFGHIATRIGDFYTAPHSITTLHPGTLTELNKTAILIGTPTHHNLGDHLIADNEIFFLREYCGFEKVIEIPTRIFLHHKAQLVKLYDEDIPVFITGGGWMGDIWPEDEKILEDFVRAYHNHKIIILPQTIYYHNKKDMLKSIMHTQSIFRQASDLTIMCRDEKSYDIAKSFFTFEKSKVYLLPDMGLLKYKEEQLRNSNKVLCCFRNDREQICDEKLHSIINKIAKEFDLKIENTNTVINHAVPLWRRNKELKKIKKEFKNAGVVITDRLHGMIFAVISGSKCIAIDNKTHKVEGVYKTWLKGNPNVVYFDNNMDIDVFQKKIRDLLNNIPSQSSWYIKVAIGFDKMAEIINDL